MVRWPHWRQGSGSLSMVESGDGAHLRALSSGELFKFSDWPNEAVPKREAGVYTVWRDDKLIYVGMSGQKIKSPKLHSVSQSQQVALPEDVVPPDEPKLVAGLFSRLNSHASGRRSGDQFCVYVCDRFVVPRLTSMEQQEIGQGTLSLDGLTREFIRGRLSYRFVATAGGEEAFELERQGTARRAQRREAVSEPVGRFRTLDGLKTVLGPPARP